ncbi:MAG: hypothetical protein NC905_06040 [Candidatus Omnitrophica bacterium]|nr:hypothetical protein [Candidatus Omnitrophota bacterium]
MKKGEIVKVKKRIIINGKIRRDKIVKKVVSTFIGTEYKKKGKGIIFLYPVEEFPDGTNLFIARPGHKKNFDFKVEVEERFFLGEGTHIEIAKDLRNKKEESQENFKKLLEAITKIYTCLENDVDKILQQLNVSFKTGAKVDILLKIIKWLFIMEDIIYWDNEGRAFLFNFLKYVSEENNKDRLKEALEKIKNPDRLKSYMKKSDMEWITPEK